MSLNNTGSDHWSVNLAHAHAIYVATLNCLSGKTNEM